MGCPPDPPSIPKKGPGVIHLPSTEKSRKCRVEGSSLQAPVFQEEPLLHTQRLWPCSQLLPGMSTHLQMPPGRGRAEQTATHQLPPSLLWNKIFIHSEAARKNQAWQLTDAVTNLTLLNVGELNQGSKMRLKEGAWKSLRGAGNRLGSSVFLLQVSLNYVACVTHFDS